MEFELRKGGDDDEWVDVTPKEELLRIEIDRLRTTVEKSRAENDALKNSETILRAENVALKNSETILRSETWTLRDALESARAELQRSGDETRAAKASAQDRISVLEANLAEERKATGVAKELVRALRSDLAETERGKETAIARYKAEKERLEDGLKTARTESNSHRETVVKFAEDYVGLRHELAENERQLKETERALEESKGTTGTIAALAEELKTQKHGLELALKEARREGRTAKNKVRDFRKETIGLRDKIEELERHKASYQEELDDRLEDLEASGRSVELLQIEVKDAERSISELASERDALHLRLSSSERGRQDLESQNSKLEELIQDDVAAGQAWMDKFEENCRSEEKSSRLEDVHTSFDLEFTAAAQPEVAEIQNIAFNQIPLGE